MIGQVCGDYGVTSKMGYVLREPKGRAFECDPNLLSELDI